MMLSLKKRFTNRTLGCAAKRETVEWTRQEDPRQTKPRGSASKMSSPLDPIGRCLPPPQCSSETKIQLLI
ncbi:hypothetical protein MPTK1_3g23560 [Marchantia polymorpha subsp. ruderalis]|uniref:Uncharacterized protein n=2 Tax=Marchantia polymorpha TaxID=3197 RepID=A0AAF6B411_MARPO|nr:hypothetical protein MARPO_0024s0132 [Marchantia polymorpha]BBN06745.1 hypothetical protein Mp_3g23560 [Marchantia polymorpha subsp. ruderalis]|eukprot:PTQ43644.1 hypothetical protein MARPO_0024s0132 [Marchantia polymorpha]